MYQFSAGATIVNFFSYGAVLFTLANLDGTTAVPASIGLCLAVMFVLKIFGANMMRLYLSFAEKESGQGTTENQHPVSCIMSEVTKKQMITDIFDAGARKGWNIAVTSTVPNVLMAFVVIKALKITGALDMMGTLFAPIMGLVGLPGEAAAVLMGAWMSMGGAVSVVISLV